MPREDPVINELADQAYWSDFRLRTKYGLFGLAAMALGALPGAGLVLHAKARYEAAPAVIAYQDMQKQASSEGVPLETYDKLARLERAAYKDTNGERTTGLVLMLVGAGIGVGAVKLREERLRVRNAAQYGARLPFFR